MRQNTKNVKQTVKNNLKQAKLDALAAKAAKTKTEKTKTQKCATPKPHPEPVCTSDGDCCCPTPAAK